MATTEARLSIRPTNYLVPLYLDVVVCSVQHLFHASFYAVVRTAGGPPLFWSHAKIARYMSPEVARALPANETADCYSFAMVMWEMVSLELPFQFYGVKQLNEQ